MLKSQLITAVQPHTDTHTNTHIRLFFLSGPPKGHLTAFCTINNMSFHLRYAHLVCYSLREELEISRIPIFRVEILKMKPPQNEEAHFYGRLLGPPMREKNMFFVPHFKKTVEMPRKKNSKGWGKKVEKQCRDNHFCASVCAKDPLPKRAMAVVN